MFLWDCGVDRECPNLAAAVVIESSPSCKHCDALCVTGLLLCASRMFHDVSANMLTLLTFCISTDRCSNNYVYLLGVHKILTCIAAILVLFSLCLFLAANSEMATLIQGRTRGGCSWCHASLHSP